LHTIDFLPATDRQTNALVFHFTANLLCSNWGISRARL